MREIIINFASEINKTTIFTLKKMVENNKKKSEYKDMQEYHTYMSLKATTNGDIEKAKDHARKAQAYRQELEKLSLSEYKA